MLTTIVCIGLTCLVLGVGLALILRAKNNALYLYVWGHPTSGSEDGSGARHLVTSWPTRPSSELTIEKTKSLPAVTLTLDGELRRVHGHHLAVLHPVNQPVLQIGDALFFVSRQQLTVEEAYELAMEV